jgi:ribonucleoside-diphosphate reductase alpha chain
MTAGNTRLLKIRHRAVLGNIDGGLVPDDVLRSARSSWDEALAIGEQPGYRNAQATVLAPTGKIAFVMDRDTTGIKPDLHS